MARGDRVLIFAGGPPLEVIVKDVVDYEGAGTDGSALFLPLAEAQALLGRPGSIRHVLISNRGDEHSGAALSDEVVQTLEPVLAPLGLDVDPSKQDAIETADEQGSTFMAFFTTFGSSIAAGILLIFLVFVMLATERRGGSGSPARSGPGAVTSSRRSRSRPPTTCSPRSSARSSALPSPS